MTNHRKQLLDRRGAPKIVLSTSVRMALTTILSSATMTGVVQASPNNCSASGTTYLCSGNQSAGVEVGSNSNVSSSATVVNVTNLTPLSNGDDYSGPFLWLDESGDRTLLFNLDLGDIEQTVFVTNPMAIPNFWFSSQPTSNSVPGANLSSTV